MKKKFTLDDLLKYHYNELSAMESLALEHQLEFDEEFRAESEKIVNAQYFLNSGFKKPSDTSIQYILNYDRKSSGELEGAC